jgi:hypothetical protein
MGYFKRFFHPKQRRFSMKKLLVLAISVAGTVSQAFGTGASVVDAVSSATMNNNCKFVAPVTTTSTTAVIRWTETRTGGTCNFCYGNTNPPAICRSATGNERTAKTISLSSLLPGTTYYIYIQMTMPGETPYGASASFATQPASGVSVPVISSKSTLSRISGNRLYFGSEILPNDRIIAYDFTGKTLFTHSVSQGEAVMPLPRAIPAAYCISIKRGNSFIRVFPFSGGVSGQ